MATSNGGTRVATASYIESMLRDLRSMSVQINADFLAYLLEMAMIEAAGLSSDQSEIVNVPGYPDADDLAHLYMTGQLD